jgi:hypothetical protein
MTFKQKLKKEHPQYVNRYGECMGCPHEYRYEPAGYGVCKGDCYQVTTKNCKACWNREMGERR